ncbi:hypothetical protein LCGC14_0896840 [marine sediment metagenome]|uniref:Uncharacterized protein n=1 Tax=marine sediment metagenome TaxID=412755 RepID=A0A0F9P2E8_9ZZZZ
MKTYEQNLKDSVTAIQGDLEKDRNKRKSEKNRNKEKIAYNKLPGAVPKKEFWCDHCSIDFVAPSYKTWSIIHEVGAWHSFCPLCEGIVYRHITDKIIDPYYNKSEKLRVMRGEAYKDLMQPGEYGYQTMYGEPFEHYYKRFQESHELLHDKYASMGLIGKTMAQKNEEDDIKEMLDE